MKPLVRLARRGWQAGLTMVELLVSLVLVSLITLVVLALYTSSASSYKTIDSNQQLQDNARFIFEVVSQAVRQAGLQDGAQYAAFSGATVLVLPPTPDASVFTGQPPLFGYNNGKVASLSDVSDYGANDNGGATINFSDVLGVRYFGSSRLDTVPLDAGTADGSVIDCRGEPVRYPDAVADIGLSIFLVERRVSDNEPELKCVDRLRGGRWNLVSGVESFQVMYAVDTNAGEDTTPNRWLNGKQVGDANLWPRVRMIRVGMILRGSVGSATTQAAVLYPFGEAFSNISGTPSAEVGMSFVPPNDGRLRRAFAFNLAIRNPLD